MRRRASSAARSVVGEVGPVRRAARSASALPKEEVSVLILACCSWLVAIVKVLREGVTGGGSCCRAGESLVMGVACLGVSAVVGETVCLAGYV